MSYVLTLIVALFVAVLIGMVAGLWIAVQSSRDETVNAETHREWKA